MLITLKLITHTLRRLWHVVSVPRGDSMRCCAPPAPPPPRMWQESGRESAYGPLLQPPRDLKGLAKHNEGFGVAWDVQVFQATAV